jgi:hypothetical protein
MERIGIVREPTDHLDRRRGIGGTERIIEKYEIKRVDSDYFPD